MHANMLTLNGKKMAKSTGNYILPSEIYTGENDILSKAFTPSVARFFMLQAHYRSILDFSDDAIVAAEKGFYRLMETVESVSEIEPGNESTLDIASWQQSCYDAMNDDFNCPILIAQLFEGVRFINLLKEKRETLLAADLKTLITLMNTFIFEVLGLEADKGIGKNDGKLEGTVKMLIEMRNKARADKDFALSDFIRNQLTEIGIELKDGKEGTTFSF